MSVISARFDKAVLDLGCAIAICMLFAVNGDTTAFASPKPKAVYSPTGAPCANRSVQPLKSGQKLQRELGGGECHSYEIALSVNQFLHVIGEQQGIDVVLTIYRKDHSKLSEVDRPNGSFGMETISIIAPTDGSYLLEVRSLETVSARGKYTLTITPVRATTVGDARQIAAEKLVSEGETLRSRGSAESFRSAIERFSQAAEAWRALENDYEEALALYGAGFTCTSLGDNQAAIDHLSGALQMFIQLKSASGEAMVKAGLGWPYMYLADLDRAFESFAEAFELHRSQGNIRGQGLTLYGMGWVHALRGENQMAIHRFTESLSRRRNAMDRRGEALTLTGLAKIQGRLGNQSQALGSLNLALKVLPTPRDRYAEADILSNLGWVHSAMKENKNALDYFNRALALRQQVGDSIGEATTLYGMSIVHRRDESFAEAEFEIEEALKIIESLRAKGSNQQLRISYFASVQDYYEFYITLLMQLAKLQPLSGYAEKTLHACERARARGLLDLLAEAKVDLRQGVDLSLLEREGVISENLRAAAGRQRQHASRQSGSTPLEANAKEIRELGSELDAIRGQIRTLNPRYAALTQPQPLTAAEIQNQMLDENTLLLQYTLGEERSFLLAVTSNEIKSYELPSRGQIERLARRFYDASTIRNHLDSGDSAKVKRAKVVAGDAEADRIAQDLSRILLEPAKNKLSKHRLVVVAPGALQFIPFAALPIPFKQSARLSFKPGQPHARLFKVNWTPLIEEHEVVVLPSMTTLSVIRREVKTRSPKPKVVVVLGDPVFDAGDGRIAEELGTWRKSSGNGSSSVGFEPSPDRTAVAETVTEFPRLTSSRWEGEKILSILRPGEGKLVTDFAADRTFASSSQLGTYRIIHFATHALIDFQHPKLSGLVLSMVDEQGRSQDGFLRLHDIFNLKLPVELVVLSGCRTALGTDYAGEGFVGLTHGFMYAGASRVVVSLWQVADKPTSELMVRFYKYMLGPKKLSPAAALRAAQLELRQDPRWRAPYFWAPFILQGEWR